VRNLPQSRRGRHRSNSDLNLHGAVYQGSVSGRFGNRKPPSSSYATLSPCFDYSADLGVFFGGNFWDGRATGWNLGSPAAEQAQGPFLNPVEQAVPDSTELVSRVCGSDYGDLFRKCTERARARTRSRVTLRWPLSIAAFEGSKEMNPFSSKYDLSLAGKATLEPLEQQALRCSTTAASAPVATSTMPPPPRPSPTSLSTTWEFLRILRIHSTAWTNLGRWQAVQPSRIQLGGSGLGGFLARWSRIPRGGRCLTSRRPCTTCLMPQSPRWFRTPRQAPGTDSA